VNDAWPTFPCASVASQLTVVAPSGKRVADAGAQLTTGIGPARPSTASGLTWLTIGPAAESASRRMAAGMLLKTGGVWSTRFMVVVNCFDVAGLPWLSWAPHVTTVGPIGNVAPEA